MAIKNGSFAHSSTHPTILTFQLSQQIYALPAQNTLHILEADLLIYLPQAPPVIQGAMYVQGQIVPIIDLRHRFHLPPYAYALLPYFILISIGGQILGLGVETVGEPEEISPAHLYTRESDVFLDLLTTHAFSPDVVGYLSGVAKIAHEYIPVLNVRALLSHHEQIRLMMMGDKLMPKEAFLKKQGSG